MGLFMGFWFFLKTWFCELLGGFLAMLGLTKVPFWDCFFFLES